MRLSVAIDLNAGGEGSGCNPDAGHCGRPSGGTHNHSYWLKGGCYYFAKKLANKWPSSQIVGIFDRDEVAPHTTQHIGIKKGNDYYDSRGKLTKEEFQKGFEGKMVDMSRGELNSLMDRLDKADWEQKGIMKEAKTAVNDMLRSL